MKTFVELGLSAPLLKAIDELGRPYRELDSDQPGILLSRMAGTSQPTVYMSYGYRLPRLAAVVALLGIVLMAGRYFRRDAAAASAIR